MSKTLEILKKYWNYDAFRTPQEDIINSVLSGNDTLGLMPTGGGKSVCFQIPAIINEGICLVISPLIALMKDQVNNLQIKGIKAIALTGGINENEISDLLDNCLYGNYKFLYLSPERLQSDWIVERIKNLPINLIAIDEAHCVSQWGHDFRPAYLKISKLKDYFPAVPFLALTATATHQVKEDIILQLKLSNPKLYTKSFARENLAYMVYETEDKIHQIERFLKNKTQPTIIYVTNRKSCIEISNQLLTKNISTTFYHGGLSLKDKDKNMQLWMQEKAQVMVATNAFGMGIDKANVTFVFHYHLPQNLENYYQEAGRAGRNGENAYAILLVNPSDVFNTEKQFISVLADRDFLILIYKKLCSYFQIAYGEGIFEQFSFNINQFCSRYDLPMLKTYNALIFLDRQGILTFSQEYSEKISLQFIIPSKEVIRYNSLNPNDEEIILTTLRTYPGVFDLQTTVNLSLISKKSASDESKVLLLLKKLHEKNIIELYAKSNDATITFNEVREDEKTINRVYKYLELQNQLKISQFKSVVNYINHKNTCKSKLLLNYFGENKKENCGICSYCINLKNNTKTTDYTIQVLDLLKNISLNSREIQSKLNISNKEVIFALQSLLETNKIKVNLNNTYSKL